MKSIIMTVESVKAILAGRKTMERRVIKDVIPPSEVFCIEPDIGTYGVTERTPDGEPVCQYEAPLPYKPGDVLQVKETYAKLNNDEYLYMATNPDVNVSIMRHAKNADGRSDRWMSPILMPREAARLFLRVTSVRVERVQDIRFMDALKEGVTSDFTEYEGRLKHFEIAVANAYAAQQAAIDAYHVLWDGLNAKRGYGWDANPWVWVIGFERVENPEVEG